MAAAHVSINETLATEHPLQIRLGFSQVGGTAKGKSISILLCSQAIEIVVVHRQVRSR